MPDELSIQNETTPKPRKLKRLIFIVALLVVAVMFTMMAGVSFSRLWTQRRGEFRSAMSLVDHRTK